MKFKLELVGYFMAIVLVFFGALAFTNSLGYVYQWVAAPFVGELEQRQKVQSGEFRMYSYEHFYDLCASIQRKQRTLMAQEELDNDRAEQNAAALKGQIQNDISKYNADARKEETMGQFKANDLPEHINYSEKEIVQCR
jgi:hypothetical protein